MEASVNKYSNEMARDLLEALKEINQHMEKVNASLPPLPPERYERARTMAKNYVCLLSADSMGLRQLNEGN
jgi:hypothetical protein